MIGRRLLLRSTLASRLFRSLLASAAKLLDGADFLFVGGDGDAFC